MLQLNFSRNEVHEGLVAPKYFQDCHKKKLNRFESRNHECVDNKRKSFQGVSQFRFSDETANFKCGLNDDHDLFLFYNSSKKVLQPKLQNLDYECRTLLTSNRKRLKPIMNASVHRLAIVKSYRLQTDKFRPISVETAHKAAKVESIRLSNKVILP